MGKKRAQRQKRLEEVGHAVIAVATTGAGLALGPAGAMLGSAVGAILNDALSNRLEKFSMTLSKEVEPDDLARRIEGNPLLVDLLRLALEAAARTDWEAKRVLLARALDRASTDDARIDAEAQLIQAAGAVEAPEAHLLARLEALTPTEPPAGGSKNATPSATRDELLAGTSRPTLLDRQLGTLIREGLAREISGTFGGQTTWGISDFGRRFLEWLRDAEQTN